MNLLSRCSLLSKAVVASLVFGSTLLRAATGTFVDRELPTDIRVAQYNVMNDAIFADTDPTRAARFARIAPAMNADVWMLQEVNSHSQAEVLSLFNTIAPLPNGASWNVYKTGEFAIVSRYSLNSTRSNISPAGYKQTASAIVDLPNATYSKDLYLMDAHFKAFSGFDPQRQDQADAIVSWERDARTSGGTITLPAGTPMIAAGDLNLVDGPQPYQTLLDGNIIDEAKWGSDSPPDWDGTSNTDPGATQNDAGALNWTWRHDSEGFAPSRLDLMSYTDSVISAPHRFVLNTTSMSLADLSINGLQQYDVSLDNTATSIDHLPVITDFRLGTARTLVWNTSGGAWGAGTAGWVNTVNNAASSFASGDVARFRDVGVGTVTIAAGGVTPGATIVSNTNGTYHLTGGPIAGSGYLLKMNAGSLELHTANTYTGGTIVGGGWIFVSHPDALGRGSLQINSGGNVRLSNVLSQAVLVTSLNIANGGMLDLFRDNDLVIDYTPGNSPLAQMPALLSSGRLRAASAAASKALGYAEAPAGGTTFSGRAVDGSSILVKYTFSGDTNLDSKVDIVDLGNLASHWQQAGLWSSGDVNYDGTVNIVDLGLLAGNWQAGALDSIAPSLGEALASLGLPDVSVPEPALLFVTPFIAGLFVRARRSVRRRAA